MNFLLSGAKEIVVAHNFDEECKKKLEDVYVVTISLKMKMLLKDDDLPLVIDANEDKLKIYMR